MKRFNVTFERVEDVRFSIEADSKAEVRKKIKKCEWELGDEEVDNILNRKFKIEEITE